MNLAASEAFVHIYQTKECHIPEDCSILRCNDVVLLSYRDSNTSQKHAAFILCPEDEGSVFFITQCQVPQIKNIYICIQLTC